MKSEKEDGTPPTEDAPPRSKDKSRGGRSKSDVKGLKSKSDVAAPRSRSDARAVKSSKGEQSDSAAEPRSKSKSKSRSKSVEEVKSKSRAVKGSPKDHVAAATYILHWQASVMPQYARSITDKYIRPLEEYTMVPRSDSERSNTTGKLDHASLRAKLSDALKQMADWDGRQDQEVEEVKQKHVTLAELSCLGCLKVLVSKLNALSKINERLKTWMLKNQEKLHKYASELEIMLKSAKHSFEAVATIAEVFQLKALDRKSAKAEFREIIGRGSGYDCGEDSMLEIDITNTRRYIKPLEARINHFRTLVFIIGTSMKQVLQSIYHAFAVDAVEVKTSELYPIVDCLPNRYLFAEDKIPLTPLAEKILAEPPKGHIMALLAPISNKKPGSSRRSKSGRSSRRGRGKTLKTKFNNPIPRSISKKKKK